MTRIRLATAWLSGCSGCHMSLLNLHNDLLELLQHYNLVYSPFIDIKEFPQKVDIALIEGAVSNTNNLEMAKIIRERTSIVASMGDCALNGNVTALRNPRGKTAVLDCAYALHDFQPDGFGSEVSMLLNSVLPLHHVIRVDAFIPGCPPEPDQIGAILEQLSVRLSNQTNQSKSPVDK